MAVRYLEPLKQKFFERPFFSLHSWAIWRFLSRMQT